MLKNLFYNMGSKGIVVLCQFFALTLTNHIIGPEGRGVFLAAITWSNTFFIFTHCSLNTGILHLANKEKNEIKSLALLSVIASLVLGTVSLIMAFIVYSTFPGLFNNLNEKYLVLTLLPMPLMMLQQFSLGIFQIKGKFRIFNFIYSTYAVSNITGIVLVWILGKISVDALIYINLISWAITGLFSIYSLREYIVGQKYNARLAALLIKTSISAHLSAIITFVVIRSDILIVNYFSTKRDTGIYGLAVGIVQTLIIIPMSIQNLLYHALLNTPEKEHKKIVLQYCRITTAAMFTCALVFMLLAKPVVYILGGANFEAAVPLLKYFLPGMIFYSLPMVLSAKWVLEGMFKKINIVSLFVLIVSVTSNIILIPRFGIKGGGIAFLTAAVFVLISHLFFVRQKLGSVSFADIFIFKKTDLKDISGSIVVQDENAIPDLF